MSKANRILPLLAPAPLHIFSLSPHYQEQPLSRRQFLARLRLTCQHDCSPNLPREFSSGTFLTLEMLWHSKARRTTFQNWRKRMTTYFTGKWHCRGRIDDRGNSIPRYPSVCSQLGCGNLRNLGPGLEQMPDQPIYRCAQTWEGGLCHPMWDRIRSFWDSEEGKI